MRRLAAVFGAGCIGRGMIGQSLFLSGYDLVFIEKIESLAADLTSAGQYPIQTASPRSVEEMQVTGVRAVHSESLDDVAEAISAADVVATAVGAANLPDVAEKLAYGLTVRCHQTRMPVNILVCENLLHANRVLRDATRERFPSQRRNWFDNQVGFVEMVVNRMVPRPDDETRRRSKLMIRVEPYDWLYGDSTCLKTPLPPIHHLTWHEEFEPRIRVKLYIHNMGHAVTAYFGQLSGCTTIDEAIAVPAVREAARSAMREAAQALHLAYDLDAAKLEAYIDSLLDRFTNPALGDTVARVGADPLRKLSRGDRFAGAAELCRVSGIFPEAILRGMAAGLLFLERVEAAQQPADLEAFLREITGIRDGAMIQTIAKAREALSAAYPAG